MSDNYKSNLILLIQEASTELELPFSEWYTTWFDKFADDGFSFEEIDTKLIEMLRS
jgi:hypothetical protein